VGELSTYHQHCCDDQALPIMVLMNPFISLLKVLNNITLTDTNYTDLSPCVKDAPESILPLIQ
jgi:hypothetical protein